MVEAGGEVRTRGRNAEGRPWQIAIERPDAMPQRAHFIVPLSGLSMATSGDYRIYFERGGRRYSHEIDPGTGQPIRHGLASVSVVAPECGYADAMATALIVLGPEKGYALAAARNIAAHFIVREPDGALRDRQTPAFAALGGTPRRTRVGDGVDMRCRCWPVFAITVAIFGDCARRDGDRRDAVGALPARLLRRAGSDGAGRREPVLRDVPESRPTARPSDFPEAVTEAAPGQCSRCRVLRVASGMVSRRAPVPRVFVALRRSCQKR